MFIISEKDYNDYLEEKGVSKYFTVATNKSGGVSGYQLQRKSGDSWKTVANTTSTNYTVKSLKAGTTYNFRVCAYKTVDGKKYHSAWSSVKSIKCK